MAVTFAHPGDPRDPHESLTARGPDASVPRLGFDGSVMKRHDDSQRIDGLAVTFAHSGDPHDSLTARRPYASASVPGLRFRRMVMTRHDDSQRIDGLAVTQRGGSRLTRIWAGLYTRRRMGTDSIQPSRRLAVTQRDERVGSCLTRIWAGLYTRPRMGTDTIQPSRRLPTTDYRLPTSRAAADLAAPVLTAAPLMRVAHSRRASAGLTADPVGRNLHRSTAACVAALAGTSIQTTDTSVPDHSCRRQIEMRASRSTGWSDGRATVLSRHPIAQKRGCKMILKEP